MWRVWHWLFGWDYVVVLEPFRGRFVRRVRVAADGSPYVVAQSVWDGEVWQRLKPARGDFMDDIWLTCLPEKYFGKQDAGRIARAVGEGE